MMEVLFLIRAYNDLDIQLPLIAEFAKDPRFKPHVMVVPSDGFITHVYAHEAVEFMSTEYKIKFSSLLDHKKCPFGLRWLYWCKKSAFLYRQKNTIKRCLPLRAFFQAIDVGIAKIISPFIAKHTKWIEDVTLSFRPQFVFCDEVLFQYGRAPFIDYAIPSFAKKGAFVNSILTGHRVYNALKPKGDDSNHIYKPSPARHFFVPSKHNQKIYKHFYPDENIIVAGNLRMDVSWINSLHKTIFSSPPLLPHKPIKIVMMLSKINYGVDVENIKKIIRELGQMNNVALAIKPHTRAMKFNFMSKEEIGSAVIVDSIPSTSLIEWGDIVLMTGSSIIFHAILRGKVCGFMKFCQNLDTIFDDENCTINFKTPESLIKYIEKVKRDGFPALTEKKKTSINTFVLHEVHGDVENGMIAKNYKAIILEDANLPIQFSPVFS